MKDIIVSEYFYYNETCDECGHNVSDLREWSSRKVCSECEEMLTIELEKLQELN